ncbi:MAG: hypothetical protein WD894_20410 [Pirellulales bacterium]
MNVVKNTSVLAVLGRAFWVMFGPLLLTASGLMILFRVGTGWRTGADITYLATLVLMVLARWAEFSGGEPQTSTGEPSTIQHFRRFSAAVLIGGLAFYILANLLSNYVLG